MSRRFGLSESTIRDIRAVFSRHGQVERAILYGSRARGDFKNGSDIDLTLCGGDDLTLPVLFRIMDDLDELLLPYTIDVSILSTIKDTGLIEHIRQYGVAFYIRDGSAPGLEVENKPVRGKKRAKTGRDD